MADETPSLSPKAHRTAVGSAAPAPCPRAVIRVMKFGAQEDRRHSTMPNRQLPFGACYHREKRCHAFALGDLRPSEAMGVFASTPNMQINEQFDLDCARVTELP